jgi:peptidyl-prolyl cis-trans isomerase C
MKRGLYVFLVLMLSVIIIGCAKKTKDVVIAIIDGKNITMAMIDDKISKLPPYYKTYAAQHKAEVVNQLITEELLYKEAERRHIDRDPEAKDLIKEAARKIIISKLLDAEVTRSAPVSDDDISKYYEEKKDQYMIPEVIRASHILTNTEEVAMQALEELKAGADFAELAKKYSKDLTKDRGGDLGYFKKGQMIPEFEKVSFSLNVGDTSGIVKTRFGYHIIKVIDRKEASYRSLDDVKESIRTLLSGERKKTKLEGFIKKLQAKSKIKVNNSLLTAQPSAPAKTGGQPHAHTPAPAASIPEPVREEAKTAQDNK